MSDDTACDSNPASETFTIELARKLKFIYKAQTDDMVQIPRAMVADILVALFEEEVSEKRKLVEQERLRTWIATDVDPGSTIKIRPYVTYGVSSCAQEDRIKTAEASAKRITSTFLRSDVFGKLMGGK